MRRIMLLAVVGAILTALAGPVGFGVGVAEGAPHERGERLSWAAPPETLTRIAPGSCERLPVGVTELDAWRVFPSWHDTGRSYPLAQDVTRRTFTRRGVIVLTYDQGFRRLGVCNVWTRPVVVYGWRA